MISITCDKCDRPLNVADELAGSKVACPHCGDINVVRVGPGSLPVASPAPHGLAADRAAAAGYPPDSGPEQRVLMLRPAAFRAHPFKSALLALLAVAGAAGGTYFGFVQRHTTWLTVSVAALAVSLLVIGVWKVLSLSETLEITNKRSILRRGLLSKATSEVVHDDIRNFQVTQTFVDRVLGVGTIGISSSGQDAVEIVMHDAPSPAQVQRVIDLYRPM